MAYPIVESISSGSVTTNTASPITIDLPSGLKGGNRLLLLLATYDSPVPSVVGFTYMRDSLRTGVRFMTYERLVVSDADATTASVSWTGGSSQKLSYICFRISNAIALSDVAFATGSNAGPNPPASSVGASSENLVVAAYAWAPESTLHSNYPTNYSNNQTLKMITASGGFGLAVATRNVAATSDDPGAGGLTFLASWAAITIRTEATTGVTLSPGLITSGEVYAPENLIQPQQLTVPYLTSGSLNAPVVFQEPPRAKPYGVVAKNRTTYAGAAKSNTGYQYGEGEII